MFTGNSNIVLSIIIVNYKTPEITLRCLDSVYSSDFSEKFEVIIVDNDSQDASQEIVLKHFPQVRWIQNSYNAGFGRANNLAAHMANGRYFLFLNSDMILEKETLASALQEFVEIEPLILGCQLLYPDGRIQNSAYYDVASIYSILRRNLVIDYLFKPKPIKLQAVMGSFMMLRKSHFLAVGGFDPDFFMYGEELDLCKRLYKKYNRPVVVSTSARAVHLHGASSSNEEWRYRQALASTGLLYLKQGGYINYILMHVATCLNHLTSGLLLWKMDKAYRKDFFKEVKMYWKNYVLHITTPLYYRPRMGDVNSTYLKVNIK